MKKYKKLFVSLLAAAVLTVGSAFSVMAADTYTYKVTVYAGNKGTIDGQEQKEITGLSLGSQVILDINSVKVTDDKYYVKGFRLSGRDNEEALATPTIEVDGDVDYVVAYGIKGDMVAYTVNYQDANGKTLADSQTFYGNAGDKPVVAYKYVENYIPQALALTKTLSDNESENVFTFTYTPGETDRIVETTTTVTTIVPGPTTTTTTTGTTGTGTTGTGTRERVQPVRRERVQPVRQVQEPVQLRMVQMQRTMRQATIRPMVPIPMQAVRQTIRITVRMPIIRITRRQIFRIIRYRRHW